jgi:CheY-like chemotaxis protein
MELKNIETCTADRQQFVLVVDSNDRNQQLLSTLLQRFKYKPYAVKTAKEALALANIISPVLIIAARQIDAENDAPRFIQSFKTANPACSAPVIVITTKRDPAFERDCLNVGALACLCAPVTFENFYRVIQVAIEPIPRMTIRISTNLPAAINNTRKDEYVKDLSEDGAYIMTSAPYPRDTKLSIRIKLSGRIISADAVVIYLKHPGKDKNGLTGMGLRFLRITEEDQNHIRLFIRGEMSKGIDPR